MRPLFWAGFWAFLADQVTKYLVIHGMNLATVRAIDVLPPLLNFRYGENRGINFGLFNGEADGTRWILIALAVLIIGFVLYWVRRERFGFWGMVAAGVLIGGALGNVVDRLLYGYVHDFLNMSCCGINNPFVFNVADIFIFAGAIGLILIPDNKTPRDDSERIG